MTRVCTGVSSCGSTAREAYPITAPVRAETRLHRGALISDNVGQPSTGAEEAQWVKASKAEQPPEEIAHRHRCTVRAVEARLQQMGLIVDEQRTTYERFAEGD